MGSGRIGWLAGALCPHAAVQMTWSEVSLSSLTPTTTLSTDGSLTGAETTTRCTPHTSRYGLSAATCHTPARRQHAVRGGGEEGRRCAAPGPDREELARAIDHDLHTHALPINLRAHTAAGLRLTACYVRSRVGTVPVRVLARGLREVLLVAERDLLAVDGEVVVSVIDFPRPRAVDRVIFDEVCGRLRPAEQLVHVDLQRTWISGLSSASNVFSIVCARQTTYQGVWVQTVRRVALQARAPHYYLTIYLTTSICSHHFDLRHVERIAERQATDATETVDANLHHVSGAGEFSVGGIARRVGQETWRSQPTEVRAPTSSLVVLSGRQEMAARAADTERTERAAKAKAGRSTLLPFAVISVTYLLFTVTDGALRMIVLLHAYNQSFSAMQESGNPSPIPIPSPSSRRTTPRRWRPCSRCTSARAW